MLLSITTGYGSVITGVLSFTPFPPPKKTSWLFLTMVLCITSGKRNRFLNGPRKITTKVALSQPNQYYCLLLFLSPAQILPWKQTQGCRKPGRAPGNFFSLVPPVAGAATTTTTMHGAWLLRLPGPVEPNWSATWPQGRGAIPWPSASPLPPRGSRAQPLRIQGTT